MWFLNFFILILISCFSSQAMTNLEGKTFLSPRSQSVNAARELVGWYRFINLADQDWFYGAVSATPSFGRSFRPYRIAQYFFGTDQLIITGSQVPNRQPNQLLADYFGLSPIFQSTVCVSPRITTFLVDFDGYLGFEDYYIRAHAPAVWVKNTMDLNETVINSGYSTPYPTYYMDPGALTAPSQSWGHSMAGNVTFGEVVQGIDHGRIKSRSRAGLAEIQIALGWNFINQPNAHAGLNLRGYVPTGTRPNSEVLFEPLVGNGHHGEFGVGFTGHIVLWEKDCDQKAAIYSDINLTHLFGTRQCRSFDLCNAGFFSRYMLVKMFDNTGTYTGQTVPLIDVTTLPCTVSAAVQLDLALMFSYIYKNWSFDLGYNAWLRTHENISLCDPFPLNQFGLKGIQNVATLTGASNATQSDATIFGNPFADQTLVADPSPPVFISPRDINIHSAESSFAFTNKIFWLVSYVFEESCRTQPFLGTGGEVEFEGLLPRNEANNNHNSVSQWAIWVKGGLGF